MVEERGGKTVYCLDRASASEAPTQNPSVLRTSPLDKGDFYIFLAVAGAGKLFGFTAGNTHGFTTGIGTKINFH